MEQTPSQKEAEILFPDGIIGFGEHKEYTIVSEKSKEPFLWLQSKHNADLSFIVIDPREFKPDYVPQISEADKTVLRVKSVDECRCFAIVAVPEDSDRISANLLAPVFINRKENIGKQVILQDQDYSVQHLIIDEMLKQLEEKDASSFAQTK
ncbi:MAG: flagellar assembly protein FliW [Candidatus Omnitrophica bacterium]|nr:flagellar assembly protein FliW [Candidatus Omnitrophota bacterium]